MAGRPFRVLGVQQIAVGAREKEPLRKLWIDLLGLTERAFAMTLDYLTTRKQFGRPIGSFQALQHRAVDLRIQIALTRASVESAAATLDSAPAPEVRQAAVSRAKARAAKTAMLVTRQAIQLHGAIGYTWEQDLHLWMRRAGALERDFGDAAFHLDRVSAFVLADGAPIGPGHSFQRAE